VFVTPELAALIQRERDRDVARSQLVRAAALARACCDVPADLIQRLVRLVRPTPVAC
jgi:hypothetical protein